MSTDRARISLACPRGSAARAVYNHLAVHGGRLSGNQAFLLLEEVLGSVHYEPRLTPIDIPLILLVTLVAFHTLDIICFIRICVAACAGLPLQSTKLLSKVGGDKNR